MKGLLIFFTLAAMLVAGCERNSNSDAASGRVTITNNSEVVIEVDGDFLTYNDLECYAAIRGAGKSVFSTSDTGTAVSRKRASLMQKRAQLFAGSRLLVHEAKRRGLTYSTNDIARILKRYAKQSAEERRMVHLLAEEDMYIAALRKDILSTTPEEGGEKIQKCLKRIAAHNKKAVLTNDTTIAGLNKLKSCIVSGEKTFENAAKEKSEDDWVKEMGCEWGSFRLSDLEGEDEILAVLLKMKIGDISDAVAGDGGYMIFRLDGVTNGTYSLSRIFRRRMAMMEEESADELCKRFRQEACEKKIRLLVDQLLAKYPPHYPNGTNFLSTVKGTQK